MSEAEWARAGALYVPVMAAALGGVLYGRRPRMFAGCLVSLLWALISLLALQRLNQAAGWWSYAGGGPEFCGMPVELYLGWVVLWGLVPQLCLGGVGVGWCAAAMVGFDLIAMPMCGAVVRLGPWWLLGEAVAVAIVLVPALCVARWTVEDRHLRARAVLQVATSGMLSLFFGAEMVFALRPGRGWTPLLEMASWERQLGLQMICVLALPGVAAVMEFAERGRGTPIPYDPPKRLMTSGVYRYIANPMQVSCGVVMLAWAGMLRDGWMDGGGGGDLCDL